MEETTLYDRRQTPTLLSVYPYKEVKGENEKVKKLLEWL